MVDTTGNFDVLQLYAFILKRLQGDVGLRGRFQQGVGMEGVGVEDVAAKVLDRVNIMRVFDLVGVIEAVGEIRDELEGRNLREEREKVGT